MVEAGARYCCVPSDASSGCFASSSCDRAPMSVVQAEVDQLALATGAKMADYAGSTWLEVRSGYANMAGHCSYDMTGPKLAVVEDKAHELAAELACVREAEERLGTACAAACASDALNHTYAAFDRGDLTAEESHLSEQGEGGRVGQEAAAPGSIEDWGLKCKRVLIAASSVGGDDDDDVAAATADVEGMERALLGTTAGRGGPCLTVLSSIRIHSSSRPDENRAVIVGSWSDEQTCAAEAVKPMP